MGTAVTAVVVGFVGVGAAWAQPGPAGAPAAEIVQRATDPVSGARVTVYAADRPGPVFELSGVGVSVRKAVANGSAETTIETPTERLVVRVTTRGVSVDGTAGALTASVADRSAAEKLARHIGSSDGVRRALDLLHRVSHHSSSPIAHLVLSTRVMLWTLAGERDIAKAVGRSVAGNPARLEPVAMQMGPGDCWDEYAQEAIEAYMEYEDCVDNEQWWDVAGLAVCLGIYEMRAIGAFSWWLKCVAIRA